MPRKLLLQRRNKAFNLKNEPTKENLHAPSPGTGITADEQSCASRNC
jgi:hypothetical protein